MGTSKIISVSGVEFTLIVSSEIAFKKNALEVGEKFRAGLVLVNPEESMIRLDIKIVAADEDATRAVISDSDVYSKEAFLIELDKKRPGLSAEAKEDITERISSEFTRTLIELKLVK